MSYDEDSLEFVSECKIGFIFLNLILFFLFAYFWNSDIAIVSLSNSTRYHNSAWSWENKERPSELNSVNWNFLHS